MKKLIWVLAAVVACGKGGKDKDKPAAEPFKGPLTVAKVMGSKDVVKPLDAWEPAFAKLQAAVGAPTKVDGDKHYWAAMDGDDCAYFYVEREDGKQYSKSGMVVGAVQSPATYNKDGAIMNRAECLTLVGKGVPAEDPNAEAPRTDGPSYQVSEVQKLAAAGRSKWTGKQIKVSGFVPQLMGDEALLYDRVDDNIKLSCKLDAGAAPPATGALTVVQGTVAIQEFVRGDGTPGTRAELTKCSVVPLDCKGKVAELKAYFDLVKATGAKAPRPWPTGDAKADAAIRAHIEDFNKKMAKASAKDLAKPMGDADLKALAKCPPALARHKEAMKSSDADRIALVQSVVDKFAECDCQADLPMWTARQYIGLMIASGGPITYQ